MEGKPALGGEEANAHALQVASGGTRSATASVAASEPTTGASDPAAIWGEAHRLQLADFIHCCRTGETPVVNGPEGRHAVELVLAVYEAARSGQVITLS